MKKEVSSLSLSYRPSRSSHHELELDPHRALEADVLDVNVFPDNGWPDADSDRDGDLGVDLLGRRSSGEVENVVRDERYGVFHQYDVCGCSCQLCIGLVKGSKDAPSSVSG